MKTARFEDLFAAPIRNGVSYPSARRGVGVPMVNMGEAFAHDVIKDQDCERVPLTESERERFILEDGDLLFVRQSLKYEGAGRCVLVGPGREPRTWDSHLIRVRLDQRQANPRYYYYYFRSAVGRRMIESIIEQVAAAGIRGSDLRRLAVHHPSLEEQTSISEVLGVIDDKIENNQRVAEACRELGLMLFCEAVKSADADECELGSIVQFVSRGIAPRYTEDAAGLTVLNQRCIRNGRVSLSAARLTVGDKVPQSKRLRRNDVLVNSTGVGTLGRVARWSLDKDATVDSHVSVVRFDESKAEPICAAFAMLLAQPEIEQMGEGSTGQTELGRAKLSALRLRMPPESALQKLKVKLEALELRGEAALAELLSLASVRDTLLPKLISGEIRVRDAEQVVEDLT